MKPTDELAARLRARVDDRRAELWDALEPATVRARIDAGDQGPGAVARLVELFLHQPEADRRVDVARLLRIADLRAVEDLLDGWWLESLVDHPGPEPAEARLAALVSSGWAPERWLRVWLAELDGPGSEHLADAVLGDWPSPHWADAPDAATRVRTWARSEPVVTGLTLIGGVHLGRERLAEVLDRLV